MLKQRTRDLLEALRKKQMPPEKHATDTRLVHATLFRDLTPTHFPYYAGHYRGSPFRCLDQHGVRIPSDPLVGSKPDAVAGEMKALAEIITQGLPLADTVHRNALLPRGERTLRLVEFACDVFELFNRIHPYANGNGHSGRFLIWSILGKFGMWPWSWTIEPKPPDPPYSDAIYKYRRGDKAPLLSLVLQALTPPAPVSTPPS